MAFTRFTRVDVVRHPLVARIVEAYDQAQLDATPDNPETRPHETDPVPQPAVR